ncbi:MAG: VWA domain-containing protein [Acidobacteriia bacterium]|nr:VWA domain-containing protein [Terriglobia bacterium]
MKIRSVIFFLSSFCLLGYTLVAQNPGQNELPSAPSASQQKAQPPAPVAPPPQPQAASAPQATNPQSQPSGDAAKSSPAAPAEAQPVQTQPSESSKAAADTPKNSQEDDTITTIRKIVNEVNVVFTVTDKHGRYIRDLKKDDFKIMDDRKPATEISSFRAETDLPLDVGLLIDASNSIRDRFKFEQEAAIEFLSQTIRRKYDQAFVVGFDVTPEVTQDFTDNTEALSLGVRALRPGGGTALYDALYFACRDKLMKAEHTGPARKAVILLSDGDDNQSHVTREEAIEMAQRAEVVVYTISTNLTGSNGKYDKILERIAEATGGRSYVPFQLTEVANAFAAIQEELRSQYAISYKPADFRADGHYRTIEILAKNQKKLQVRSRRGYYSPVQ